MTRVDPKQTFRNLAISANLLEVTMRLIAEMRPSPATTSATARSVWVSLFPAKAWVRGGLTKIRSTPIVQNALTSLFSVHGSPHGKGLTLPKSIESGNLGHNEAFIRWMPTICDFLQLFWGALE